MNKKTEGSAGIKERFREALDRIKVHDHLCLIYENRAEQFAAIIPFIRAGVDRWEKCIYVADDNTSAVVLDAMRTEGIDVNAAISSGALAVISKKEAYLKAGYFDPDLMIDFLRETTAAAKTSGFTALRVAGEMTWQLGGIGVDLLMEYEAKLNRFFAETDALAICQYNRTRFGSEVIRDVIRTHPLVIYGRTVCRNMYYVPPDEFLGPEKISREVERLLNNMQDREQAEQQVLRLNEALARKVEEMERKNAELETLLKAFVGRELRIAELKEKVAELEHRANAGKAA